MVNFSWLYRVVVIGSIMNCINGATLQGACKPPEVEFGEVKTTIPDSGKFQVGKRARVRCNRGYDMIGNHPTCTEDGTWENLPTCKKRGESSGTTCENPFSSASGVVINPDKITYDEGDKVTLSCGDGFLPSVRNTEYECGSDGKFEGEIGKCIPLSCTLGAIGDQLVVENKKPIYKYKEKVKYSCEWGYMLDSDVTTSTCGKEGKLIPSMPKCIKTTCKKPKVPKEIRFYPIQDEYEVFEYIAIRCANGFKMKDDAVVLTCTKSGTFSGKIPTCKKSGFSSGSPTCPQPSAPKNGNIPGSGGFYQVGDEISFTCDDGYRISGSEKATCNKEGVFDPKPPNCKEITCNYPPDVSNGYYELFDSSRPFGSIVEYFCNEGYHVVGNKFLGCKKHGEFGPSAPVCEEITTCFPPKIPAFGKVTPNLDDNAIGQEIRYSCDIGLRLIGEEVSICRKNGQFFPDAPRCEVKSGMCNSPEKPTNGFYTPVLRTNPIGIRISYHCDDGYKLVGSTSTKCLADGSYSDGAPFCRIADCEEPPAPDNGRITYGRTAGDINKIIYVCDQGHVLEGAKESTCKNGKYEPNPPKCLSVNCDPLRDLKHGRQYPRLKSTPYETTVRFRCDPGYRLVGDSSTMCERNGYFSNPPPKCLQTCDLPNKLPKNVKIKTDKELFHVEGDKISYYCPKNYKLEGDKESTCLKSGYFSSVPKQCKAEEPSCKNTCEYKVGEVCQCDFYCSIYDNCCSDQRRYCDSFYR